MPTLRHEVWKNPANHSIEFCVASARGDELRLKLAPHAELIHVLDDSSREEAMCAYYDWQGWGPYRPVEGLDDLVYTEDEAREQQAFLLLRPTS
jgi:hypothetical protein